MVFLGLVSLRALSSVGIELLAPYLVDAVPFGEVNQGAVDILARFSLQDTHESA